MQDLRTLRHVRLAPAEIPRVTQVPLLQVPMETTSNTTTVIYSYVTFHIAPKSDRNCVFSVPCKMDVACRVIVIRTAGFGTRILYQQVAVHQDGCLALSTTLKYCP